MTDNQTPAEIAVAYIEAWGRGDLEALASHLADDVVFESPTATTTGVKDFLEEVRDFAQIMTGVDIIAVTDDDEQALIMYDMFTGPFGTLRAADRLVIRDGKIAVDSLVFDTYEVRNAQFEDAPPPS